MRVVCWPEGTVDNTVRVETFVFGRLLQRLQSSTFNFICVPAPRDDQVALTHPASSEIRMNLKRAMDNLHIRTVLELFQRSFKSMHGQSTEWANDVAPQFNLHLERLFFQSAPQSTPQHDGSHFL